MEQGKDYPDRGSEEDKLLRQDPKDIWRTVWRLCRLELERVGVKVRRPNLYMVAWIGHSEHCGFCRPVTGCEQVCKGSIWLLC